MKDWHFNVLFVVGVGGAVFLLVAPSVGLKDVPVSASGGVGLILAYVLSRKDDIIKKKKEEPPEREEADEDEPANG